MNNTRLYLSRVIIVQGLLPVSEECAPSKTVETLETKLIDGNFVHLMNGDLSSLSCLHTHHVSITSDRDTRIRFFENVGGSLFPMTNHSSSLKRDCKYRCSFNFKSIALATTSDCFLQVKISPRRFVEDISSDFSIINNSIVPTISPAQLEKIVSRLFSGSISLPIAPIIPAAPKSILFSNIRYYLNLTSVVTLTDRVEDIHRYSPFSVKPGSGIATELHYSIRMKTAAGDAAVVKFSCIESISNNSYSILKTASGEELSMTYTGRIATGFFSLPPGVVDVGLLISTPYGFRGDLNDDPDVDLIAFDVFRLTVA